MRDPRPPKEGTGGARTAGAWTLAACTLVMAVVVFGTAPVAWAAPSWFVPARIAYLERTTARPAVANAVGLRITLKVSPGRPAVGTAVTFRVHLVARHAIGALGYRLSFGDGTERANVIPLYCRAGPGVPATGSWRFNHRYTRSGVYDVTVTGYVNCTASHVVTRATVTVT